MDSKKQILWISTLRGLAVLLVFISHLYLIIGSNIGFIIGRIGVVFFFLIAGYLAKISRAKRTAKQYIINRLFRIYPTYWIILLLSCVLSILLVKDNNLSVSSILFNMTLFNEFMGVDCIIGSSWMLPIMVCFYLIIGICGIEFFMSTDRGGVFRQSGKNDVFACRFIYNYRDNKIFYKATIPHSIFFAFKYRFFRCICR